MLRLFFTYELTMEPINARINFSDVSSARIDVLILKSNSNETFSFLYRFKIPEYIMFFFLQIK